MINSDDYFITKENIKKLEQKGDTIYNAKYKLPTDETYAMMKKDLIEFIKQKKRIIYGGYAMNSLIISKDKSDDFYGNCRYDIEFYTPTPVKDSIDIAMYFHNKKYDNVVVGEALHPDSYKLYVEFENICDITYMDKNVYDSVKYINMNDLQFINTEYMLIDAYRTFTDPMTSYFRLQKSLDRIYLILQHYPFDKNYLDVIYKEYLKRDMNLKILDFIRHNILQDSNMIIIGHYAVNYFISKVNKRLPFYPYYEVISDNYIKDRDNIYKILKKKYKDISFKKYHKFFQFYGERSEFYYKKQVILKLYSNNDRCNPYIVSSKKKLNIGSYQLVIKYLLIGFVYNRLYNFKLEKNNYKAMLNMLVDAKNTYFDNNKLNLLDESPFKHYIFECFGRPLDLARESRLRGQRNIKNHKKFRFEFRPEKHTNKDIKYPNYKFNNESGLPIKYTKTTTTPTKK